jgi:glycosyltransferase 2 family protein
LLAFEEYRPGFMGALFIQSGAALAIAIPSTPGYIGPFEASLQVLLKLYEIPAATILSYAIALRVVMYITVPIIAIVLVFRLGLRFPVKRIAQVDPITAHSSEHKDPQSER